MNLFGELKRRNVFRVGIAYVVLGWVLLQVTDVVVPILDLPGWVAKLVLFLLAIGFPLILLFAWAFELTPEGIKREKDVERDESITPQTGKKLDRVIIAVLAVAVVFLVVDRFLPETSEDVSSEPVADDAAAAVPAVEKSVAVLPFLALSAGENDEYFADGLTEEILNSLAQLPELLVTARTSAFAFKGRDLPIEEIAATLGVRHVVEGSVRRAGDRLRVTAQLIRAQDGFHIWSQNYDRNSDDTIAVQEDIAEQIALALDVVLDTDKRKRMQEAGLRDVVAFTEYQKGLDFYERAHGEADQIGMLLRANEHFERVIERVPDYAPAYIDRTDLYVHALHNDSQGDIANAQLPDFDRDEAMRQIKADYAAAIRHARNEAERRAWEVDIALLSGNWGGLPARFRQIFESGTCVEGNWLSPIAVLFGFAEAYLEHSNRVRACDPLASTRWFNGARAAVWAGDLDQALAIAREGSRVVTSEWLNYTLVSTHVARGNFDAAEGVIATRVQDPSMALMERTMLAAAAGDAAAARAHYQAYVDHPYAAAQFALLQLAWLGERDEVNRQAAVVDRHPMGHQALTNTATWCLCGAPFDLDHTPNLARKLDEAGFSWPPPKIIDFPLKDW